MNNVTFGKSKPIEELTLSDLLDHPIWIFAVDEEGVEGQDETWIKPIISTTDVHDDIVHYYPSLLYRVAGTALHAFGDYQHHAGEVLRFSIWQDGQWKDLTEIDGLQFPITLTAVATILGQPDVRFVCNGLERTEFGTIWRARRAK